MQCRTQLSASANPEHITEGIKKLLRGHTAGLFLTPPFRDLHCSPLGAVSKKEDSYRLIMDLSSPSGSSINGYISDYEYPVTFSKFYDAIEMLQKSGKGALMGKIDIRHAFRICPVRSEDYELLLLGTYWGGGFYFIELRLPFSVRTVNLHFQLICRCTALDLTEQTFD